MSKLPQTKITGYFKENGDDITKSVNKGLTKCFIDQKEAIKYARQRRSYTYPVYVEIRTAGQKPIKKYYGLAVPA